MVDDIYIKFAFFMLKCVNKIMSPVLKIKNHDERKELIFELEYLLSLTTRQRFEMMFKKSEEMKKNVKKKWIQKNF